MTEKERPVRPLIGSSVSGTDISLDAKENFTIEAAANTSASHSASKNASSSIGVSISLGTSQVGPNISASQGKGKSDEHITTHTPGSVTATGSLDLKTGQDTTISGSQISGNTVVADIGGNLRIESKQDTETYTASSKSSGFGIAAGVNGGVTGSTSKGKTDSTYQSVTDQAGIYAGTGGFDIEVGGNTDLKGAVIASEATLDKNRLSTDTLTYSDIENKAEYSASSVGVNLDTREDAEKKDAGLTPGVGVPASDDASSTTQSAIASGTIEVRSNPEQDLSNLSRDPSGALNALGQIFDKKTVQEKQELAKVFGEVAYEKIGEIALQNGWIQGGPETTALHALVGGIMANLGGGSFASGAMGAGASEAVQGELSKITDPALRQWASAVVGAAASSTVGNAQTGSSTAASGTKNNALNDHWITLNGVRILFSGYVFLEGGKQVLKDKAGNVIGTWVAETKEWVSNTFNPPATDIRTPNGSTVLDNPANNPSIGGTTTDSQQQGSSSPPPIASDDPNSGTRLENNYNPVNDGNVIAVSQQPLGRGNSRGGHQPETLAEQLAMEQAISNPQAGRSLDIPITDSRWPEEGWVKKAQNINGVEVHYVYNTNTGEIDDFKIK